MTTVPASGTPRTDNYVEAWNRINGYDFGAVEKGPYRHGVELMRVLERESAQAAREAGEYKKDAERYRWCRMRPTMRGNDTPEEFDAIIDAALAADDS